MSFFKEIIETIKFEIKMWRDGRELAALKKETDSVQADFCIEIMGVTTPDTDKSTVDKKRLIDFFAKTDTVSAKSFDEAFGKILRFSSDSHWEVRFASVMALSRLAAALEDPNHYIAQSFKSKALTGSLSGKPVPPTQVTTEDVLKEIRRFADDPDERVRKFALFMTDRDARHSILGSK